MGINRGVGNSCGGWGAAAGVQRVQRAQTERKSFCRAKLCFVQKPSGFKLD